MIDMIDMISYLPAPLNIFWCALLRRRVTRGGGEGERPPLPFFKIQSKVPWFWKKMT